ncbi:AMP-binding protein [Yinghuangia sp. YIM S09857]|uniref:AMP-binding protein n=1 Tax=Yinghuangia sp. YIM S09857 TaxID=3436929 RepID=UPI003F52A92E
MSDGNAAVWAGGTGRTVPDLLQARLREDPHTDLFDVNGERWTTAELDRAARIHAAALQAYGVGKGDRVATLTANSSETVVALFGAMHLGAVAVPVNSAFKGDYLRHQLNDSGSRVVVVDADLAPRVQEVADDVPCLEHVVVAGEFDWQSATTQWHRWDEAMNRDPLTGPADVAPTDTIVLIYTGGTTGPSKGCVISHNYAVTVATQIARQWQRRPEDVVWTPLPLFHFNAYAIALVGTLLIGGQAAIYRKFSVSRFWPEINRTGATMASTLGSMVALLADDAPRPEMPGSGAAGANTSLRFISGAPIAPALAERWHERFGIRPFDGGYGTTEACLLSWLPPGVANKPGAAGVVNSDYWDVRVFDDADNEVPVGEPGEIVARPRRPGVMFDGYWGRPEATLATFGNLWHHSGDVGRIDEDGYLFFLDRKADYLRRRGENVSSSELEAVFAKHADVADVAVHAVPSPLGEDDIKVTLVLRPGAGLTEQALFRWCQERVPYFALPSYIEFRADLPRTVLGKVLKTRLREEGVTPRTWRLDTSGISVERR